MFSVIGVLLKFSCGTFREKSYPVLLHHPTVVVDSLNYVYFCIVGECLCVFVWCVSWITVIHMPAQDVCVYLFKHYVAYEYFVVRIMFSL